MNLHISTNKPHFPNKPPHLTHLSHQISTDEPAPFPNEPSYFPIESPNYLSLLLYVQYIYIIVYMNVLVICLLQI